MMEQLRATLMTTLRVLRPFCAPWPSGWVGRKAWSLSCGAPDLRIHLGGRGWYRTNGLCCVRAALYH
jgi:hypothetical protein